jgi:hypothetical protein
MLRRGWKKCREFGCRLWNAERHATGND